MLDHINNQNCSLFKWGIFATGGMRNNVDKITEQNFYNQIINLFQQNQFYYQKAIELVEVRTISIEDEANFAWLTVQAEHDTNQHILIDMGGASMQFTNGTHAESWNLGLRTAINALNPKIYFCYNNNNNNPNATQYNGDLCRNIISEYLDEKNLVHFDYSQFQTFYAISTFHLYFDDICSTYLQELTKKSFSIKPEIHKRIENICEVKKLNEEPIFITPEDYRDITDSVCLFWDDNWDISKPKYQFAKETCFIGNYLYQILEFFDLEDKNIYVNQASWNLEAAYYILNTPSNNDICPQPYTYGALQEIGVESL